MIMLWQFCFFLSRPLQHSLCCSKSVAARGEFLQLGAQLNVGPRPHSDQNCPSFVHMWDRRARGGGLIYNSFAAIILLVFWRENQSNPRHYIFSE